MSKLIVGLLLLIFSISARAETNCDKAFTTSDINACAQKDLERTEAKLNSAYQATLARLLSDSKDNPEYGEARQQLIDAQRKWVKYREADCRAIYTLWSGGTIRTVMYIGCMQGRAEQRTKELAEYDDSQH